MTRTGIAIIGAGFSGSLLAVQILRRFAPDARIYLIEQNAKFGRGLAYSTGNPNHLLNVRASRMSAFADDPDHFMRWLGQVRVGDGQASLPPVGPNTFVPRAVYGAYIQDLLGEEIWRSGNGRNLYLVPDEAIGIARHRRGLTIETRGGRTYDVEFAVLATGNIPNANADQHRVGNPWSPAALAGLDPAAAVLLTGTGLTMVDTVISLVDQGHRGPITAVSRRGLLPRRHGSAPALERVPLAGDAPTPLELLRRVRAIVRAAASDEANWRSVVDSLRPYSQTLWQSFTRESKERFLRHLRPWWEVHRHRMAPEVAVRIDRLIDSGQLRILAGRLEAHVAGPAGLTAKIRLRGREDAIALDVARWIDCSGLQQDYAQVDHALIRDLLQQGHARPDPMRLGLEVSPECALIDREGLPSERLFAIGPVTRGTFWEITSVPDIREQCWELAQRLVGKVEAANCGAPEDIAGGETL